MFPVKFVVEESLSGRAGAALEVADKALAAQETSFMVLYCSNL